MKLTKRHIGRLFDIEGADGSWAYMLADVNRWGYLFYAVGDGRWWKEKKGQKDWREINVNDDAWALSKTELGWEIASEIKS